MTNKFTFFLVLLINVAFSQNPLSLIPQPQSLQIQDGNFILSNETIIQADETLFEAQYLQQAIKERTGIGLRILPVAGKVSKICISRTVASNVAMNGYQLTISKEKVTIAADQNEGFFYGIQTLLQILPIESKEKLKLPCLRIEDAPKFKWRGMHLDCARHFFTVSFVKKYIDYLAAYKFSTFHWHLTDDQGWRIEIKKYPKLTQIGAWRNGSMIGHYREHIFDDKHYGGFYTQDEIKEVVAYAAQRHITIVPEIEMPGHALAALASYPEFSCTGGPFEVAKQWGILDDVFCPKAETINFLENILTEVMDLFPSEYIHIGGDECPKTRWKKCPNCQETIKQKGLKDEHELQSYFIQTIEKFVNNHGRKIIGWDEILEGGLAPNAAVMSWRGTKGGIDAAKQHHFVVMTPGSHCYFDHYQGDPKNEPLAIGGYTPVEKVYAFNPVPPDLATDETTYIIGAQANVWTEYMYTPENVEYMIFPRILALSEVLWGTSNPAQYVNFQNRMIQHFAVFDRKGITYSKAVFEVITKVSATPNNDGVVLEFKSANDAHKIKYTTDGVAPTVNSNSYTNSIVINKSQTLKAAYFENDKQQSTLTEQTFYFNKATGKKITLVNQPHESYNTGGAFTLVDGILGNSSKFGRDWLGFSGKDLNAVIDLGKSDLISTITVSVLANEASWIYYPSGIEVLYSLDGQNYTRIKQVSLEDIQIQKGEIEVKFTAREARFIKVIAANIGKIPDGSPGAGNDAWLFVDEIGVN